MKSLLKLLIVMIKRIDIVELTTKIVKNSKGEEEKKVQTLGFSGMQLSIYFLLFVSVLFVMSFSDTFGLDYYGERVSLWWLLLPIFGLIFLSILKDLLQAFAGTPLNIFGNVFLSLFNFGALGGASTMFYKIFGSWSLLKDDVTSVGGLKLVRTGFTKMDFITKAMSLVEEAGVNSTVKRNMVENLILSHPEIKTMGELEGLFKPIISQHIEHNRIMAEAALQVKVAPIINSASVASDSKRGFIVVDMFHNIVTSSVFGNVAALTLGAVACVLVLSYIPSVSNLFKAGVEMSKNFVKGVEKDLTLTKGLAEANENNAALAAKIVTLTKDVEAVALVQEETAGIVAKHSSKLVDQNKAIEEVLKKAIVHIDAKTDGLVKILFEVLDQHEKVGLIKNFATIISALPVSEVEKMNLANKLSGPTMSTAIKAVKLAHPDWFTPVSDGVLTSARAVMPTGSSENL